MAIRAIAKTAHWRLTICGTGPEEGRLRALTKRLGVSDRVSFLGWQPREEVHRLMIEQANLFLFPSLHDEASFAVVEALSCGLPVLCVDLAGPPVLVGFAGISVDPGGVPRRVIVRLAEHLQVNEWPSPEEVRVRAVEFLLDKRADKVAALPFWAHLSSRN